MSSAKSTYIPISEVFKNRIIAFVQNETLVAVEYNTESWERVKAVSQVHKVFRKLDEEFLELSSGTIIRLDRLVTVDLNTKKIDKCGIDRDSNPCGDASDY